jgi:hypothetical protein
MICDHTEYNVSRLFVFMLFRMVSNSDKISSNFFLHRILYCVCVFFYNMCHTLPEIHLGQNDTDRHTNNFNIVISEKSVSSLFFLCIASTTLCCIIRYSFTDRK